jgi:hypothetical protein
MSPASTITVTSLFSATGTVASVALLQADAAAAMSGFGTLTAANSNITANAPLSAVSSKLSAGERTTFGHMAASASGVITNEAELTMFIHAAMSSAANIQASEAVYKNAHFDLWGAVG